MTERVHNFSAGPCTLPLPVLEESQAEFVDYHSAGMSLIEMSHRGKHFVAVHEEAIDLVRSVYGVPDEFDVLRLEVIMALRTGVLVACAAASAGLALAYDNGVAKTPPMGWNSWCTPGAGGSPAERTAFAA